MSWRGARGDSPWSTSSDSSIKVLNQEKERKEKEARERLAKMRDWQTKIDRCERDVRNSEAKARVADANYKAKERAYQHALRDRTKKNHERDAAKRDSETAKRELDARLREQQQAVIALGQERNRKPRIY